jgi:predicted acylesterase/phospholipase RssA
MVVNSERLDALPSTIGLCLSGGGFRAASFHLGALRYLQRVGLLDRVRILSTVSGGTILGVRYALSLSNGQSFAEFFARMDHDLRRATLFTDILRRLADDEGLSLRSGKKNLITVAAAIYARDWFSNDRGEPYRLDQFQSSPPQPIEELCFNATDFSTGLAFRFQHSRHGLVGNLRHSIDRPLANQLRLSDIVAASSCFPGGFEPLAFPDDFVLDRATADAIDKQLDGHRVCLMDGGVYDNQGIESVLHADRRRVREQKSPMDLFIVCDTDPKSPRLFSIPPPIQTTGKGPITRLLFRFNPRLKWIDHLLWITCFLCLESIAVIGLMVWRQGGQGGARGWSPVLMLFGTIVPLVLAIMVAALTFSLRSLFRSSLLPLVPELKAASWQQLRRIRLWDAVDMLQQRVASLLSLTSDVFMKRIRSLTYSRLYDDPAQVARLMPNFIDHLQPREGRKPYFHDPGTLHGLTIEAEAALREYLRTLPLPSESLEQLAIRAAQVPTRLWFDDPSELDGLLRCGTATTCFNLMRFVIATAPFNPTTRCFEGAAGELWQRLLADWLKFQDPNQIAIDDESF